MTIGCTARSSTSAASALVEHERVDQAAIARRDVRGRRAAREPREHPVGRPLDGAAADQRADGDGGRAPLAQRRLDLGDGEDRADADVGVARRDQDQVGAGERLEHARRGPRRVGALVANAVDLVAVPARDEPLLEGKASRRRVEPRAQAVVGRRQQPSLETRARARADGDGDSGSPRRSACVRTRWRPEVAVAEPEPRLAAELARPLRARSTSRRLGPSRAPRRRGRRARRRCCRGRARRGGRAPRRRRRRCRSPSRRRVDDVDEAAEEARAADAAGQRRDLHVGGPRARPRADAARSRSRSASESTSSARFGISAATASSPMRARGAGSARRCPAP